MAEHDLKVSSGGNFVAAPTAEVEKAQVPEQPPGSQHAPIPGVEPGPSLVPGSSGAKDRNNPAPGPQPGAVGPVAEMPHDHVVVPQDPAAAQPHFEVQKKVEVSQQAMRMANTVNQIEQIVDNLIEKVQEHLPDSMGPYVPKAAGAVLSAFAGQLDVLAGRLELIATKLSDVHNNINLP